MKINYLSVLSVFLAFQLLACDTDEPLDFSASLRLSLFDKGKNIIKSDFQVRGLNMQDTFVKEEKYYGSDSFQLIVPVNLNADSMALEFDFGNRKDTLVFTYQLEAQRFPNIFEDDVEMALDNVRIRKAGNSFDDSKTRILKAGQNDYNINLHLK